MSSASFDHIRRLLAESSAIQLDDTKEYLVEARLRPIVRRAGMESIDQLVTLLRRVPTHPLREEIVNALTVNETSFFRDQAPFDLLRTTIIPALFADRAASRQLNIWSAACASGQELYSVAFLLREHFADYRDWNLRLLGTDLSSEMVERARTAQYSQMEVERGLPEVLLQKYFCRVDATWELDKSVREMCEFRSTNLGGQWPPLPRMDLILLRNVLVYFSVATRKEILRNVRQVLRPQGYLLLGGAETSLHLDDAFRVIRCDGFSYYQIKQG